MARDRAAAEAMAATIAERLADLGLTETEACRRASVGADAIRNIRRGHVPGVQTAAALASALGVRDLAASNGAASNGAPAPAPAPASPVQAATEPAPRIRPIPGDMVRLVRGGAAMDDVAPADGMVGVVPRPAELVGRAEGFCAYIDDDLNLPMIRRGHVAMVDPARPVGVGHMVRVVPIGAEAFVGALMDRTGGTVTVRVMAEAEPRAIPADKVARLERIVGFSLLEA